jgi:chromosomal replication initiation ATPase DnaA
MSMTAMPAPRQLALALEHPVSFARENFFEGPANAAALALIESYPDWPDNVMMLVGPRGSGKSHLAAIWAEMSGARITAARMLDRFNLTGALATGALVIEDLGPDVDEAAAFHLLNLARQERAYLLLTGQSPPAGWPLTLPDLASRLRAVPVVSLSAPDDRLLRAVYVKLFADRQLAVDEGLIGFLVNRVERSFPAAREAVARLDREALRLRRPVTRALAAELYRATPDPEANR